MKKLLSHLSVGVFVFAVFLLGSCGEKQKAQMCTSPGDTPEHHYNVGMNLLEKDNYTEAEAKFKRSIECNQQFSPGYSGLAVANAMKASKMENVSYRDVEIKNVRDYLSKAKKTAKSEEDKFSYYASVIRVNYYLYNGKTSLEDAYDAYKEGKELKVDENKLIYYEGKEALDYFMGLVYIKAGEFQKARDSFSAVLSAKRTSKWHSFADRQWKRVDKIARAVSGITIGDIGKKVAMKDSITRADLAAMLVDELKIDKVYAGKLGSNKVPSPEFIPADIANHQFKQEILTILGLKVRGLEPVYDNTARAYLFKPDEVVKRGEFALILEDIMIKLTGDEKLARAYLGHEKSPFPDIRPTSVYYNAVMNVTSRGLMEPELSGEFRVNDPVDGAELILAIRVLKQRLNI